jgi:hypothetical protein
VSKKEIILLVEHRMASGRVAETSDGSPDDLVVRTNVARLTSIWTVDKGVQTDVKDLVSLS